MKSSDKVLASRLAKMNAPRARTKYEREIAQQRLWNRKKALENLYAQAPRLDETTQQTTFGWVEDVIADMTQSKTEQPKKREPKKSEVPKWILERKNAERRSEKK